MKQRTNCVFCGEQKSASGYRYEDGVKWVCVDCQELWIETDLLNDYRFKRIKKVMDKVEEYIEGCLK